MNEVSEDNRKCCGNKKVKTMKTMQKAKVNKSFIPGLYDRKSGSYDSWGKMTEEKARQIALSLVNIRDGESILEVAAGSGLMFQKLVRANPNGINEGIDVSEGMLAKAREKIIDVPATHARLSIGDARKLNFPDESFDLLVNGYMFDLIPEEDFIPILKEFNRVLKPGGRMILMNMSIPQYFKDSLFEWIYKITPETMAGCRGVHMKPFVEMAGFQNTTERYISQWGFPSEIVYAKKNKS